MDSQKKRRAAALLIILISVLLGISVGASFKDTSPALLASGSGYDGFQSLIYAAPSLCRSQMIQLALIFISGLTLLSYPVCFALLFGRCAALGYALFAVPVSAQTALHTASYAAVTLASLLLAYRAMTFERNGAGLFSKAAKYTYSFMLISGASVFMKIVPLALYAKLPS